MEHIDQGSFGIARRRLTQVSTISWPWLFLFARTGGSQPPADFTDRLSGWRKESWRSRFADLRARQLERGRLDSMIRLWVSDEFTGPIVTARWKSVGTEQPTGIAFYRTSDQAGLVGYRSEVGDIMTRVSLGPDGSFAVVCAAGGEIVDWKARVAERLDIDLPTEPCNNGTRPTVVLAFPERYCLSTGNNCDSAQVKVGRHLPWVTTLSDAVIEATSTTDASATLFKFSGTRSKRSVVWFGAHRSAVGLGEPAWDKRLKEYGVEWISQNGEFHGDIPLAGIFLRGSNPVVVVSKRAGRFELLDPRDMRVVQVLGSPRADPELPHFPTAAISQDGRLLALYPFPVGDGSLGIGVVDLVSGNKTTMLGSTGQPFLASRFVGPQRRRMAFSPRSDRLMYFETQASIGDQLVIWDTATGKLRQRWGCKSCREDGSPLPMGLEYQQAADAIGCGLASKTGIGRRCLSERECEHSD